MGIIKKDFNVEFSTSHLSRILRIKFKELFGKAAVLGKPYTYDYKRSKRYKNSFYLKLWNKLKKYKLKYDPKTGNLTNTETNEPFLIYSFDESSQQFSANYIRVWSLNKPKMAKNTQKVNCNTAGFYPLTPEGVDHVTFLENSKAVTIEKSFRELRDKNPKGVIMLLIDNYPSHHANILEETADELNIELLFLPTYSPQLQPEEKIWYALKRLISAFKVDCIPNLKKLNKVETEVMLKEKVNEYFYELVKSKSKWNLVLNNYIKPIIKFTNPKDNKSWEVEKVVES
jgi:transposase